MRSKQFDCIRREIESEHARDRIGHPLNKQKPWNEVLRRAALGRDFWEETVKEPSVLFLYRNKIACCGGH